jgi:hypothetical protein
VEKQSTQKNETVGLNVHEARQRLAELLAKRQKVKDELATLLGPKPLIEGLSKSMELSMTIDSIDRQITEVREWYDIGLTELLYDESKRLNKLTEVLIGLTAILGVLTIADILLRVL